MSSHDHDDPTPQRPGTGATDTAASRHPTAGTRLPSGAVVTDARSASGRTTGPTTTRRTVLTGIGAALGGFGLGMASMHAIDSSRHPAAAATTRRPLTLIYGADICDAPAIVAKEKGFFSQAGLDVTLRRTVGDEDIKAAVGSGRYDASSGIFYSWLRPVEEGQDVTFVAGLHGGCLRLIVPKAARKDHLSSLRGATIGVPSLHSSATMFFSMDLLDAGINPLPEAGQVNWKVMDSSVLADALRRGQVDAIATSDPIAYRPVMEGYGYELASNMSGANAQEFCCCTALNGKLVREEPEVARALVEAWAKGARYVAGHEAEVAHLEVDRKYVAGDVATVERLLKTYTWKPSVTRLRSALMPGIRKFRKTGYLGHDVDVNALADKAFTTLGLTW